jgi:hypothetical protein
MKIRVLGGGWYGCHIANHLIKAGHKVTLFEAADKLFAGASGGNPARLHIGPHYPRSSLTRAACRDHHAEFMRTYGFLTRAIRTNLYAIADRDSMVDFGTYVQVLKGEIELIQVDPKEYGLRNCEGAILCGERHIVIGMARDFFYAAMGEHCEFNAPKLVDLDSREWDWTIDCTFCARDAENIDRFEPCVTGLLVGPSDTAVTIMDGPFGSIYPWNEDLCMSSITSAKYTPFSKECRTYEAARNVLDSLKAGEVIARVADMRKQMEHYWPDSMNLYHYANAKLSIRAMPRSAADARLVDVVWAGERALRVRAGKIDAIFHAARMVDELIGGKS